MADNLTTMQSVQQKVQEKIKAQFADLIPDEMYTALVTQAKNTFFEEDAPKIIREELTAKLREHLKVELDKPEWRETWNGREHQAPVMVQQVLAQLTPELVSQLFSGVVMHSVMKMRNDMRQGY